MKWLDTFIYKCLNRARSRDEVMPISSGRGNKLGSKTRVASKIGRAHV